MSTAGEIRARGRRAGAAWRERKVFVATPAAPTRWEELLRTLRISEGQALVALAMPAEAPVTSVNLRMWIKRHYHHRFVPEAALEALGLHADDLACMGFGPWGGGAGRHIAAKAQFAAGPNDGRC